MIVKTFARGVGAGIGPVGYCVAKTVQLFDPLTKKKLPGQFKERIPPPVVMRGDPNTTILLIDSSQNIWKYTSGVIAFADSDSPTIEQQQAVIDSFEQMAFAGLDKDQYQCLWVKHAHEGNVELHFVTPRLELATGKALNIAPPGHVQSFNAWRDSWNYATSWASPREPARKRLVIRDDHEIKNDAARLKVNLPLSNDPKRLVTDYLVACVESGLVRNRDDVIRALTAADIEITRAGSDYLSVRPEPGAKPIRLKGALYDARFEVSTTDTATTTTQDVGRFGDSIAGGNSPKRYRNAADDAERAESASAELARIIESRTRHNRQRYQRERIYSDEIDRELKERNKQARKSLGERGIGIDAATHSDANRTENDATNAVGNARPDAATGVSTRSPGNADSHPNSPNSGPSNANAEAAESDDIGTPDRFPAALRRELGMDKQQHPIENTTTGWATIKAIYERIKSTVVASVHSAVDSVSKGYAAAQRASEGFGAAASGFTAATATTDRAIQRAAATVSRASFQLQRSTGQLAAANRLFERVSQQFMINKYSQQSEEFMNKTPILPTDPKTHFAELAKKYDEHKKTGGDVFNFENPEPTPENDEDEGPRFGP